MQEGYSLGRKKMNIKKRITSCWTSYSDRFSPFKFAPLTEVSDKVIPARCNNPVRCVFLRGSTVCKQRCAICWLFWGLSRSFWRKKKSKYNSAFIGSCGAYNRHRRMMIPTSWEEVMFGHRLRMEVEWGDRWLGRKHHKWRIAFCALFKILSLYNENLLVLVSDATSQLGKTLVVVWALSRSWELSFFAFGKREDTLCPGRSRKCLDQLDLNPQPWSYWKAVQRPPYFK